MSAPFAVDPRIEAISLPFRSFSLCVIRLINDRRFPSVTMLPQRPDIREFDQLSWNERAVLMEEVTLMSRALQSVTGAPKMNVGMLGNHVPQMHVHVVARFPGDAAWPGPVWGVPGLVRYTPAEAEQFIERLNQSLGEAERWLAANRT